MKIKLNQRKNTGTVIFLILVVLTLFLVVVGYIVYEVIKAIHKIQPPPPSEPGGWDDPPAIGSLYNGWLVDGWMGFPSGATPSMVPIGYAPKNFVIDTVTIYGGPDVNSMTNLVSGPTAFQDLDSVIGQNGLPIQNWLEGQQPAAYFYNIVATGHTN